MDGTFVARIADLAQEAQEAGRRVVVVDGRSYWRAGSDLKPIMPPGLEPIVVHTLTGFVDYIKLRQADEPPTLVHVESANKVLAYSAGDPLWMRRQSPCVAEVEALSFDFKEWHPHENFLIALRTRFVQAPETKALAGLLANIKDQAEVHSSDDGLSQTVTTRKGATLGVQVPVPNPVELQPYRTFLEVPQPKSPFLLRLRGGQGGAGLPSLALHETDGGAWELEAIKTIADYLRAQLGAAANILA